MCIIFILTFSFSSPVFANLRPCSPDCQYFTDNSNIYGLYSANKDDEIFQQPGESGVENNWAFLWLYDKVIRSKVILSFTPCPLFQWYSQSKKILLNLSMKCWNSAFNAQGSWLIIVVVQVGAVKIYLAAAVEALRKKEWGDETQFYHQNWWEN